VLANRPDVVRADFMEELTKLQDDVPAFKTEEAFAIIEKELGKSVKDLFEEITPEPIAAASLGQVYKAKLKQTGETVAIKVQRPGIEPIIYRDLVLFRILGGFVNGVARKRLGCNAELIVDEFGEKLLEELDYVQEGRNLVDFYENFKNDPIVKIPKFYPEYSGKKVLVMEWIDGVRCTNPKEICDTLDVDEFIRVGVVSGLRQLLEFGLFHGDPHPGNIFAMRDGRIAYVDFGNVAQLTQRNKEVLIDAVVHAVNEDYDGMASDFVNLGFLTEGTNVTPFVPALERIWQDARTASLEKFNFRTVTSAFNELVYEYPIRIPERFSLVIRSLLTQEGICMTLSPEFKFLEVAYPYVAKRLLTDRDAGLRERLTQVLFDSKGKFQWKRLENLIELAKTGGGDLDLTDTATDGAGLLLTDEGLRKKLILALTEDDRLRVEEVSRLVDLLREDVDFEKLARNSVQDAPRVARKFLERWSDSVLKV
jgi:predicted unusual protein kinase regulating ubiquinone biosynthesis (AarF/ABC1/UbiB family)